MEDRSVSKLLLWLGSRHIKNVILENNLDVNQVFAKNATIGNDGKTYIVSFYNLDVIIPLGYKVPHTHEIEIGTVIDRKKGAKPHAY